MDSTISFLYEPSSKRFSLSLDTEEIFQSLIIDYLIFSLINNIRIPNKDFKIKDGKKKFVLELEKSLIQ